VKEHWKVLSDTTNSPMQRVVFPTQVSLWNDFVNLNFSRSRF